MPPRKHTIIFDCGNVILPFDPVRPCRVLSELCGKSPDTVCDLIYGASLEREFEEGILDGRQFTEGVSKTLGLDLDFEWFRALWSDMFTENTETSALIRKLAPHHDLMILSNTNRWHWSHARESFPIVSEIDTFVVSYEVGVLKPHPKIYKAALAKADPDLPAIFIDDVAANAEAARAHGITGVQFVSTSQLEADLRALGCL